MKIGVIILAAGQGTRMMSEKPKVLHKVLGKPMLSRVIDVANTLSPELVVTVLKHKSEQILEALQLDNYAIQSDIPGTGAATQSGLEKLDKCLQNNNKSVDVVLILSGDVPLTTTETLQNLVDFHAEQSADVTVLTAENPAPYGYGRIIRGGGGDAFSHTDSITQKNAQIKEIVEEKDATTPQKAVTEINSGIYLFNADFLREALPQIGRNNAQNEMYLTDCVKKGVEQNRKVVALKIDDLAQTEGVNNRVQLANLEKVLQKRINEKHMMNGVSIMNPESVIITDDVTIASDVIIEPNCYITGLTKIASGAQILLGSRLIDADIAPHAMIGPYAYLRPGANIGERAKVGTFVEVKNSSLGEGAKVPHLSYVGDATIGKGTNIGAGSIFANYDGVNKHKTTIGENSKIGSKTVLVAPVNVGDNVYTGATALIREDVPSNALAYSKSQQVVVDGWTSRKR